MTSGARPKRVLVVAGEASADMHAANLVKAINSISKEKIEFSGLGGDALISTGLFVPEFHNRDFAVYGLMGLCEQIGKIFSALKHFKRMAKLGSYDAAVLLDYPDFNIPLAKSLTKMGVPVVYYISPQVWVWREARAYKLRRYSKSILTIFPFEKDFYKKKNIDVKFVGHPVLDEIDAYLKTRDMDKIKRSFNIDGRDKIIAVLPGSRRTEIKYILPVMENTCLEIKKRLNGKVRFIVPVAPTLREDDIYDVLSPENKGLFELVKGQTYDVYSVADHVLLASGTATVEAAIFEKPMTIVYKVSCLSSFLFKNFIRYKRPIGMVNILLGDKKITEFFQKDAVPEKIADDVLRKTTVEELKKIRKVLYAGESASVMAAKEVLKFL